MPNSILVPVDGSNFAEHALPYALGIARRTGATLHLALVHVPAEALSPTYPLSEAVSEHQLERRDQDAAYVDALIERLEPSGVTLRPALLRGRVAAAIGEYVEEEDLQLLVMSTHGRGGLQRAWLGSTADSLIRHCTIPLLLVRPTEGTREIGPESSREVRHLVAALDGSDTAETALRDALELAIAKDATITLIHVLQPASAVTTPYVPQPVQITTDELESRKQHMRRYLEKVAGSELMAGRSCEIRVELGYSAGPVILDIAEETRADLIVLGTHGRGGLRRLILGSVADKVIRGTHRPVLVHRGVGSIARLTYLWNRHQTSEHAETRAHS